MYRHEQTLFMLNFQFIEILNCGSLIVKNEMNKQTQQEILRQEEIQKQDKRERDDNIDGNMQKSSI